MRGEIAGLLQPGRNIGREFGFYWVRFKSHSEWEIMMWHDVGCFWELPIWGGHLSDGQIFEVDEEKIHRNK